MRRAAVAASFWIGIATLVLVAGRAAAGGDEAGAVAPGLERALAQREYEATPNSRGLQAPNRAHNLRTYFEPTGIRVHDRSAAGSPELLAMTLASVGRGARLTAVGSGEVSHAGPRVEIRRRGLVEWYVNSDAGLEQGFTLAERPAGGGALVLELALAQARATLAGERVLLAAGAGRRLAYGGLDATDARGAAVLARFDVPSPDRLRLVIEDEAAVYPLTIDPLLTQTADAQLQGNQIEARFGLSVAAAGDVNGDGFADVIVGADHYDAGEIDEGAAFLFLGSASGIASAGAGAAATRLEGNQVGATLGFSVAGAGDVNGDGYADVIVGAPTYSAGENGEGAAFVFLGSASGIASAGADAAAAQLESNQASAEFGYSVAGAGDVNGDGYADVIVGAYSYGTGGGIGGSTDGAAFVFLGSASGVADANPSTAHAQIVPDQVGARLGTSVAGAGDVNGDGYADVIVGARFYDAGENDEGAAFVFLGSASGISGGGPGAAATLLQANQVDANFGFAVAGAGDVNGDGYADVIVGAKGYGAGVSLEGAAFVFLGSASGIPNGNPTTAAGQLESDQASALLGNSVAGAGDVNGDGYADVLAGAPLYDAGQTDEGAVFLFLGGPTGIPNGHVASAFAQLESNQADAWLGYNAAGAGDVNGDGYADVIAGAYLFDAGESNEGVAFVYLGGAQGVRSGNPATAGAQLEGNQVDAGLGLSVAGAGDVNGDGYADVIVGAPQYDAGQTDEGAAFVFLGSASGIASGSPATAAAQLESNQADAFLGSGVAGAGDVNGDGYADVIVGAWQYDAGQTDEGAAFVFLGSASGIASGNPATAAARLESNQLGAWFGERVAGAGDVNGDGYADVIVGARRYDAGEEDEGAAFVFLGSATGIANGSPSTAAARIESDQAYSELGFSVAGAGDVNGDGYADVIVGAYFYTNGQNIEGAAFVFLGSASGIANGSPATAAAQLEANQVNASLGVSVAGAGDVNGDGYADVIVGATGYNTGSKYGAAFVFLGSAAGIADGNPATAATQLASDQLAFADFGISVAGAGDVNGDGYADVIVGADQYTAGQNGEGAAFVFLGSASGIANGGPATAAAQLESNQAAAFLGPAVASAGDVNGDGYADAIVGAGNYDAGQNNEGAAFLFYGGGNQTGRRVLARQLRGGGSTIPVQPWGASYDIDDFQVRATATHPFGRGRVKLQIQVCPAGVPFGHASCTTSTSPTWTDVTASSGGVTLTQIVPIASLPPCANALDDDGDAVVDFPNDAGCESALDPWEQYACADGVDNDGDALTDFPADSGCSQANDHLEQGPGATACANAQDDDGDGLADFPNDPGCESALDPWEQYACADGVDNDGDGFTDFPIDPGCSQASDHLELDQSASGLADDSQRRWRARVLYAPFTVTQSGITAPPNPAHGPWRRLFGQALEADLRIRLDSDGDGTSNGSDPDDDGDGLLDVFETDTGTYVSPTNTGTDPLDSDSDDDGLQDGPEVALGVDPNDPDTDDDADLDGADNCPFVANADQLNGDAYAAGDSCQCGDTTGDGTLSTIDYTRAREHVAGRTPSGAFQLSRCDVTGDAECGVEDLAVLDRLTSGAGASIAYGCPAYSEP